MTGLDMLKQEMLKRGCTKAQTESKLVSIVLDIVAETGTAYTDLREAEQRVKEIEDEAAAARRLWEKYTETEKKFREGVKEYVEDFKASLKLCETPEARDALRVAQMFTDTVKINSQHDNTAYINGLAMLLCGQKIPAPMELRKVEEPAPYTSARY